MCPGCSLGTRIWWIPGDFCSIRGEIESRRRTILATRWKCVDTTPSTMRRNAAVALSSKLDPRCGPFFIKKHPPPSGRCFSSLRRRAKIISWEMTKLDTVVLATCPPREQLKRRPLLTVDSGALRTTFLYLVLFFEMKAILSRLTTGASSAMEMQKDIK